MLPLEQSKQKQHPGAGALADQRQPSIDPLSARMADYTAKQDPFASLKRSTDIAPAKGSYSAHPEVNFQTPLALVLKPLPTEKPAPSQLLPTLKPVPSVNPSFYPSTKPPMKPSAPTVPSPARGNPLVADSESNKARPSRFDRPTPLTPSKPSTENMNMTLSCGCNSQSCVVGIFNQKNLSQAEKQVWPFLLAYERFVVIVINSGRHR